MAPNQKSAKKSYKYALADFAKKPTLTLESEEHKCVLAENSISCNASDQTEQTSCSDVNAHQPFFTDRTQAQVEKMPQPKQLDKMASINLQERQPLPEEILDVFDYQLAFLSDSNPKPGDDKLRSYGIDEDVRTTPLFSGETLDKSRTGTFQQYGLLGKKISDIESEYLPRLMAQTLSLDEEDPRIFLNVNAPWSAFICGSQGSGKSYTLSCMLENCLISSKLGRLPSPLAGIVFHYDAFKSYGSNQLSEAAYLCSSGVPVRVLVSPSNYWKMKAAYENIPDLPPNSPRPEVIAMKFQDKHLDAGRMMSLMAVNDKDGPTPLYIEVWTELTPIRT